MKKQKALKIISSAILFILFALFLYTVLFYKDIRADLELEIRLYGSVGLAISGFVVDFVAGPLGPEIPVVAGLLAGIDTPTVIYMTFIGSILASLSIYSIGRFFGRTPTLFDLSDKDFKSWKKKFSKHRRITMLLGSLTPVPYVIVCLVSGVFKVALWEFATFAIGARFLRIAGAAYIALLFKQAV